MNVYDVTDVLSFRTEPFFSGVTDYEFDNVAGAPFVSNCSSLGP